jgi:hypothetical protein
MTLTLSKAVPREFIGAGGVAMQRSFRELSLPKKILFTLFVVVFFGCWIVSAYLDYYYSRTRSDLPQPELGRVYNLKSYGITKYITKHEKLQLELLVWISAGSLLGLVILVTCEFSSRRSKR